MFRDLTRLSAAGIPTVRAGVRTTRRGGGRYVPGMSRITVVMIKERSKVFLAGPPLVKDGPPARSPDDESLGGAEMHSRVSGLRELLRRRTSWMRSASDAASSARLELGKQGPAPRPVIEPLVRCRGTDSASCRRLRIPFDPRK